MTARVWYPVNMEARLERAKTLVMPLPKVGRKKKEHKTMPETNSNEVKPKVISKEVFDLNTFDTLKVGAEVDLPKRPGTLEEVMQLFNNDGSKVLDIIYKGMCEAAVENAESQADLIWRTFDEDELTENIYTGPSADESKKKVIDAMVLNFAKAAFGFQSNRGLSDPKIREANNKAKEAARAMIRNNPDMRNSIVNAK